MQRVAVTTLTQSECDEYAFLFEKLLAYRSLKFILGNNDKVKSLIRFPTNIFDNIALEEKETKTKINSWWDKIDEKYILEYNDTRILALDFNECVIYSYDKKDWYKEHQLEREQV